MWLEGRGQKKEKGSWDTLSPGSRGRRGRPAPSTLVRELPKPPVCPLGEVLPLPPAQVAIVPWVLDTGERKEGWELTRPQLPGRAGRLLSGAVPAPRPQAPVRLRSDVERGLPSSPSLTPTDSKPLLSRCVGRAAGPPNGG